MNILTNNYSNSMFEDKRRVTSSVFLIVLKVQKNSLPKNQPNVKITLKTIYKY